MRTHFFIIFFVLSSVLFYSQSTGYMGKRFLLGYGIHTSPALMGSNASNQTIIGDGGTAESGVIALNIIHEGCLEFAASSKWMVCFSARYYKTTYDNSMNFRNYNYYNYSPNHIDYSKSSPDGFYNIRGLTYSLYFKYYGSRYVAPWGRYVMFGPTLNTVKTTYDPTIMKTKAVYHDDYKYIYKDTVISNFGALEQHYKGLNLMLGYGRSRIIQNRITVDYGVNVQFFSVFNTLFDIEKTGFFHRQETINADNYIERTVRSRVRGVNRFNVFFKVGILLF